MKKEVKKEPVKVLKKEDYDLEKRTEQALARAKELSEIHGVGIKTYLTWTPEQGEIVAFIKEPTLDFEMKVLDLYHVGRFTDAGVLLLDNHIIKEESDKRISRENKSIYLGAVMFCMGMVEYCANLIKKN
jgi:hypothetical protein